MIRRVKQWWVALGKTKTSSTLLWALYHLNCRTVTCAPTNIAVLEVGKRLVKLFKDSTTNELCPLWDVVLFGSGERMKIESNDLREVFLEFRIERLSECFAPLYYPIFTKFRVRVWSMDLPRNKWDSHQSSLMEGNRSINSHHLIPIPFLDLSIFMFLMQCILWTPLQLQHWSS